MVSVAAFLIILVILFGVDGVRSFVFGTFGVVAWVVVSLLALGAVILAFDKFGDILKKRKEARAKGEKPEDGEVIAFVVIIGLAITGVFVYRTVFAQKYQVLKAFPIDNSNWYVVDDLKFDDMKSCQARADLLNSLNDGMEYKCGKNCKPDASNSYYAKCAE